MLAYAANAHPARRANSPSSLALILAGHAVLIGVVMTAKMELTGPPHTRPPIVFNVPEPLPPPPEPPTDADPRPVPQQTFSNVPVPLIDMERTIPTISTDQGPTIEDIGVVIGTGPTTIPIDPPKPAPVRIAARITSPDSVLKPPYPLDKRRAEEEATLRLKLSIDARGRVIAVEPVGPADASFLEAARRHIIRAWRYKPATEDGMAVPSSTVINLSFRLEDV